MAAIAIKYNICGGDQPCAVCGDMISTGFGPDLFLEGSEQIVCLECGRDFAPQLVELLELGNSARTYSHHCQ
jgi:hypothetical protein